MIIMSVAILAQAPRAAGWRAQSAACGLQRELAMAPGRGDRLARLAAALAKIAALEAALASSRTQSFSKRLGRCGPRLVPISLRADAPAFVPSAERTASCVPGCDADPGQVDLVLEALGFCGAGAEVHAARGPLCFAGGSPGDAQDEAAQNVADAVRAAACLSDGVAPSSASPSSMCTSTVVNAGRKAGGIASMEPVAAPTIRVAEVEVHGTSDGRSDLHNVAPTRGGVRVAEDTASGRQMVSDASAGSPFFAEAVGVAGKDYGFVGVSRGAPRGQSPASIIPASPVTTAINPFEHHDDISQADEISPPDVAAPSEGGSPSDVVEAVRIKKRMCRPKRSKRAATCSNVDQQLDEAAQEAKAERAMLFAKYGITGASMDTCPSGHPIELYTNATGTCSNCSASQMGAGYNCTSQKCDFAYCVECVKRDTVKEAAKGAGKGSAG